MYQHIIACFLSNISAKYYKNPSMLFRVIAKNVGDVFLRHSVDRKCVVISDKEIMFYPAFVCLFFRLLATSCKQY